MEKPVALYIHIPFCISKCAYCDFYSVPHPHIPDSYVKAVRREIAFRKERYRVPGWSSIYIGGGTPSLLTAAQLSFLLQGLHAREVTLEMNPEGVCETLLAAAKKSGVTRLSIGIQALDDKSLKASGRRGSKKTSLAALSLIKKKWHGVLSLDMIAGLPKLSMSSFISGLEDAVSFSPHHVSLYSLSIEDGTQLGLIAKRNPAYYDWDLCDEQWIWGRDFLEGNGYSQYEVSNFAHPGFESAHNSSYWAQEDYIGAGAGATGTLYGACGEKGIRMTGTVDIDRYISFWNNATLTNVTSCGTPETVEILTPAIKEFEFLMMGFRTFRGVDSNTFKKRFDKSLASRIGDFPGGVFDEWRQKGLASSRRPLNGGQNAPTWYFLTRKGLLFLNKFLEALME